MVAHRSFAVWLLVFGFVAIHCKADEVTESKPVSEIPEEDQFVFELEDEAIFEDLPANGDNDNSEHARVKRNDPTYNRPPLRTPPNLRGPARPIYQRPRHRQPNPADIVWAHMNQGYPNQGHPMQRHPNQGVPNPGGPYRHF